MFACYELTVEVDLTDRLIFDGASFEIEDGEWAEFTGPAGSGKSLLCSLVGLDYRPRQGRMVVAGRNVERVESADLVEMRRQIGCCRQPPEFLPGRTALENLVAPLVVRSQTDRARERGEELMARAGLEDRADRVAQTLSYGEQYLLGLLRAAVGRPRAIVVDGALDALDGRMREAAQRVLRREFERGRTVLLFGRERSETGGVEGPTYRVGGGAIRRMDA